MSIQGYNEGIRKIVLMASYHNTGQHFVSEALVRHVGRTYG
ncbi:hypothetical protein [Alicyclobacillus sp. SO9]|nr:hypothetical protein [Alicyclobacillus sp. SO9]